MIDDKMIPCSCDSCVVTRAMAAKTPFRWPRWVHFTAAVLDGVVGNLGRMTLWLIMGIWFERSEYNLFPGIWLDVALIGLIAAFFLHEIRKEQLNKELNE